MSTHAAARVLGLSIAIACTLPGEAVASLIASSQVRSVSAEGEIGDFLAFPPEQVTDSDFASAPGFAPFSESAEVQLTFGCCAEADAIASQDSTISPSIVSAVGQAGTSARTPGSASSAIYSEAVSVSWFELEFELATEGTWAVDASTYESTSGQFAEFYFFGPGDDLLIILGGTEQVSTVLALPAGSYRLSAYAESFSAVGDTGGSASAEASFSLHFAEVPEPGTLLALGIGLLGIAGVAGRRGRQARS